MGSGLTGCIFSSCLVDPGHFIVFWRLTSRWRFPFRFPSFVSLPGFGNFQKIAGYYFFKLQRRCQDGERERELKAVYLATF